MRFRPPSPLHAMCLTGCGSSGSSAAFAGVLDDHTTDLVAAYLPFRGFASYEGDCFTIRDTVGDAEQGVGFDAGTGVLNAYTVGGSAAIAKWFDQSATTAGLVQATAANQPILTLNVVNGQPVVRFDGTSDELTGSATASAARTIFIVVKKRSAVTASSEVAYRGYDGVCQLLTNSSNGTDWRYFAKTDFASPSVGGVPTDWTLVTLKYAADGTLTPYADVTTGTPFATYSNYTSGDGIILGSTGGSNWTDVDIGACLIYAAELGDTPRAAIRNILGTAFGLSWVP